MTYLFSYGILNTSNETQMFQTLLKVLLNKEVIKMTKKEIVLNAIATVNAKEVEGIYEMTIEQFNQLDAELGNVGADYALCNNKKDENLKSVYDSKKKARFAVIRIVAAKVKKEKAPKKQKLVFAPEDRNYKEEGNGYVVFFKLVGQKEKMNNQMTTCKQMKEFIKQLHHEGKIEKLAIYKMGPEYLTNKEDIIKTRLSAWR